MRYSATDRAYDSLLLSVIQTGSRTERRQAAERLAVRWTPRLLRTARRILGDGDQAQDAMQEAWIGICRGWNGLRDTDKFPGWAYGILHRKCTDRIRQNIRSRQRHTHLEPERIEAAQSKPPVPEITARTDIERAFAQLSPEHRITAIYFFSEGLTLREIADTLRIPLGTAKSRIFHARQSLKAALSGDDI